ncbi:MAG: hypothetical protein JWP63_3756 [Candidatus Solibacter sp.]|nr:hypothetical protein [Candidatus Solibacter sp.]
MSEPFVEESLAVLARTPASFDGLLRGLPDVWISATEGDGTWSPYSVIGHLIHCERTDWVPRMRIILEEGVERTFDPVNREARGERLALGTMLDEFAELRRENLARVRELNLGTAELEMQGMHPTLGVVTLRQLLATWTAHDLTHLIQVGRVLAKRYKEEIGPFGAFLSVMK